MKMKHLTRRQLMHGLAGLGIAGSLPALAINPARAASKTVRVGSLQAMSGHLAAYGQETQPVFEFLINRINASGGIKSLGGAQIELITADTGSTSSQASREARRLITQEKVDVIIGGLITAEFLAIAGVVSEYKTPALSVFAGGSTTPYGYSVGFAYDEGYAGSMCNGIAYLRDTHGFPIKRAVNLNANYEAGQQIAKFINKRLGDLGIEVVADIPLDLKSQDYLAAMLKIRNAKPDVVVGLQLYPQLLGLMQARYQLKYYDSLFVGSLGNCDMRLKHDLGPEVAAETLSKGVFGMSLYAPTAKIDALQKLASDLQGEGGIGHKFGQYSIPAAQTVKILQHALEAAATTDKEALRNAIANVKLPLGHPDLYMPNAVSFSEDRMLANNTALIAEWIASPDVEPVIVYPEVYAGGKPQRPS